jgi:PAS domain S-box-containing protein
MDALARAVIQSTPSAVVALDTEGRVTMLNVRAETLLSTDIDQALGRSYEVVFGKSLSSRVMGLFLRSVRSGEAAAPQLVRATLPSGRRAELRASLGPIRDSSGAIVGLLFVADEVGDGTLPAGREHAEAVRLREALRRYLGENVAAMVEERPSFIGVGGVRRYVSVLHADIRGYSSVAEVMEPEEVTNLLLRYHGRVVDVLYAEGATLDRFIGDTVLAFWNAPTDYASHARAAIRSALAVQRASRLEGTELAYGVGVHTGDAIVGNLGNARFQNYAAVGDTVVVAARLQAAAAPGEVLCSERALAEAGDGIRCAPLGALYVKGRKEPVQAYRVEGMEAGGESP